MTTRHRSFTPEQMAARAGRERSWQAANEQLADPVRRAEIEAAIARLDAEGPGPEITPEDLQALLDRCRD